MGRMVGERVVLREFRSEDISGMRLWVTDDQVTPFLSNAYAKPHTWEQTEQMLAGMLSGDAGGANFVIADRETLKYMGQCNLFMIDTIARKAELAIVIAREFHGRGYGYEALRLLLRFAFDELNLNRVQLKVIEDNHRAIALYERMGFVHEGRLREEQYQAGRYKDLLVMGILKREFDHRQQHTERAVDDDWVRG